MAFTDENNARWKRIREQGLIRFVLVQGVIKWGIGTALAWLAFMTLVTGGQYNYGTAVPYALIIFPSLGIVFGLALWFALNRLSPQA